MTPTREKWDGTVRAADFLSVSEIEGVPVVVFVSVVPGTEKVYIVVRHARRIDPLRRPLLS